MKSRGLSVPVVRDKARDSEPANVGVRRAVGDNLLSLSLPVTRQLLVTSATDSGSVLTVSI